MEVYLNIITIFIISLSTYIIHNDLKSFLDARKFYALEPTPEPMPDEHVDLRQLTLSERLRLERDEDFDQRINAIKDELSLHQRVKQRVNTVADELHPMVHNLPHDVVDRNINILPDVEVSE